MTQSMMRHHSQTQAPCYDTPSYSPVGPMISLSTAIKEWVESEEPGGKSYNSMHTLTQGLSVTRCATLSPMLNLSILKLQINDLI